MHFLSSSSLGECLTLDSIIVFLSLGKVYCSTATSLSKILQMEIAWLRLRWPPPYCLEKEEESIGIHNRFITAITSTSYFGWLPTTKGQTKNVKIWKLPDSARLWAKKWFYREHGGGEETGNGDGDKECGDGNGAGGDVNVEYIDHGGRQGGNADGWGQSGRGLMNFVGHSFANKLGGLMVEHHIKF